MPMYGQKALMNDRYPAVYVVCLIWKYTQDSSDILESTAEFERTLTLVDNLLNNKRIILLNLDRLPVVPHLAASRLLAGGDFPALRAR